MSPPETPSPDPPELELSPENRRSYYGLLSDIEASQSILSILIAVCDDRLLRDKLIRACERELQPDIRLYRLQLDRTEPSLRMAVATRVQQEEDLQRENPAVLMVTGAEDLLFVSPKGDRPEVDKFMGYLQWTREGLRAFRYPIVLWVTTQISVNLSEKAPDFWSWRKGVFRFAPETPLDAPLTSFDSEMRGGKLMQVSPPEEADDGAFLPLEDLEDLIARTETQRGTDDPSLGTLYSRLGQLYARRLRRGETEDYPKERELALSCFRKAIELQGKLGLRSDLIESLRHLGSLHYFQAEYQRAIECYDQSLKLAREMGNRDREAASLNNLGSAYGSQAEYRQAIEFYQQSLDICQEIGNRQGEASSLHYLGDTYNCLGKYRQAIEFYQQSLNICQEIGNRYGEASSLNNLGLVYRDLGEYRQAIEFHQQSLDIFREIGNRYGEVCSLGNLGSAYNSLGEYRQAIEFHQQSLDIFREIGNRSGEASSLGSLGSAYGSLGEYQLAVNYYQKKLPIVQKIGERRSEAIAWVNLGNTLVHLDAKWEARDAYNRARNLFAAMELDKEVKRCDAKIRDLGMEVVVQPRKAPDIEPEPRKPPRWQRRLQKLWRWLWQWLHRWTRR